MKRMTASQARRNWFRVLDEVAAGEVIVIERNGRRVVLEREAESAGTGEPDYSKLIRVPDADAADNWGWRWTESGELEPVEDDGV